MKLGFDPLSLNAFFVYIYTMRFDWSNKDILTDIVHRSKHLAGVLSQMGMTVTGGSHKTLKKYIKMYEISTSHFESRASIIRRSIIAYQESKKLPISELLAIRKRLSSGVRKRIFREGLLKYECSKCGNNGNWNGLPLTLQIDHINGGPINNVINNLRVLCPNCHSQTDNFAGKGLRKMVIVDKVAKSQVCET